MDDLTRKREERHERRVQELIETYKLSSEDAETVALLEEGDPSAGDCIALDDNGKPVAVSHRLI